MRRSRSTAILQSGGGIWISESLFGRAQWTVKVLLTMYQSKKELGPASATVSSNSGSVQGARTVQNRQLG